MNDNELIMFGAKYMDHDLMAMWLSVDPMADKYPSISPYAYCAWTRPTGGHEHRLIKFNAANNPVKLVDPDGRDIWIFDTKGNVTEHIENEDYNQLLVVDASGNVFSSNQYNYGTISEHLLSGYNGIVLNVCGKDNAENLFEFLGGCYTDDNKMGIEWGHATIDNTNGNFNFIANDHRHHKNGLEVALRFNKYQIQDFTHNHPSGDPTPSVFALDNYSHGDLFVAGKHPETIYYTYTPHSSYSSYSSEILDERLLNYVGQHPDISFLKSLTWKKNNEKHNNNYINF